MIQMKILKHKLIYFQENKKRLDIGTISKYDYLSKKYSWYDSKLDNEQQHFNLYTQQLQLINSLGGTYKIDK